MHRGFSKGHLETHPFKILSSQKGSAWHFFKPRFPLDSEVSETTRQVFLPRESLRSFFICEKSIAEGSRLPKLRGIGIFLLPDAKFLGNYEQVNVFYPF